MPTIIGVIFFCFGIYFFFLEEEGLLGLLIVSSVFEASSAINIAKRGIQPHYVIGAFIIARALANRILGIRSRSHMPQSKWLLIFGAIAIASTIALPIIFSGTPVYDPKIGIDDGLFNRPPLSLGLNNVAQAIFVAWHLATAYAVLAIAFSPQKTRKFYVFAFYLAVFFIFAQSFCSLTGIPYPDSLIRNNPGYGIITDTELVLHGVRCPGTFTEPSIAGAFILMYCVGFLVEYLAGKGGAFRVIVALVVIGLISSSGALLALGICLVALAIRYWPFRFPWHIKIERAKRIAWISFLLVTPLALALGASASYREALMGLTVSKGETGSFINRTASDLYALQLFVRTYGLGLGLGSNRASSLLTTLLSCVGLMGTLTFGVFFFKLFADLRDEYTWLRWAAVALLVNMCIDISDVTFPILWIPILLAIQVTQNKSGIPQKIKHKNRELLPIDWPTA